VAYDRDNKTLLTADGFFGPPGYVKLWQAATGREECTLMTLRSDVLGAAFSPDHNRVAVAGGDEGLLVYDRRTSRVTARLRHPSYVRAVAWSPDGKRLASACECEVRVWDVATKRQLWHAPLQDGLPAWRIATHLAFAPDGKTLAAGDGGNGVRLYDAATGAVKDTMAGHRGLVLCTAYSPDGKVLASGSFDTHVRVWDARTRRPLRELGGHTDWVFCLAFAPDGKILASAGREGIVCLWDVPTGKRLARLSGAQREAVCATFSPDGRMLAASGVGGEVRLWDVGAVRGGAGAGR
jgi:WD40 repeat protein